MNAVGLLETIAKAILEIKTSAEAKFVSCPLRIPLAKCRWLT